MSGRYRHRIDLGKDNSESNNQCKDYSCNNPRDSVYGAPTETTTTCWRIRIFERNVSRVTLGKCILIFFMTAGFCFPHDFVVDDV